MSTQHHEAMWTEASRNVEAEAAERQLAMARVATAPVFPFLAAAASEAEYEARLGLAGDRLAALLAEVTPDPRIHEAALAGLKEDWATLHQSRTADLSADIARERRAQDSEHSWLHPLKRIHDDIDAERAHEKADHDLITQDVLAAKQADLTPEMTKRVKDTYGDDDEDDRVGQNLDVEAAKDDDSTDEYGYAPGERETAERSDQSYMKDPRNREPRQGEDGWEHEAAKDDGKKCWDCGGSGTVPDMGEGDNGQEKCPTCGGSGTLSKTGSRLPFGGKAVTAAEDKPDAKDGKDAPEGKRCTCGGSNYPSCLCHLTPAEWVADRKRKGLDPAMGSVGRVDVLALLAEASDEDVLAAEAASLKDWMLDTIDRDKSVQDEVRRGDVKVKAKCRHCGDGVYRNEDAGWHHWKDKRYDHSASPARGSIKQAGVEAGVGDRIKDLFNPDRRKQPQSAPSTFPFPYDEEWSTRDDNGDDYGSFQTVDLDPVEAKARRATCRYCHNEVERPDGESSWRHANMYDRARLDADHRAHPSTGTVSEIEPKAAFRTVATVSCRKCTAGKAMDNSACDYCDGAGALDATTAMIKAADGWEQGITAESFKVAVDESAKGTDRYQHTKHPSQADWVHDEWDEGKADQKTLDEGRANAKGHEASRKEADVAAIKRRLLALDGQPVTLTFTSDWGVSKASGTLSVNDGNAIVTSGSGSVHSVPAYNVLAVEDTGYSDAEIPFWDPREPSFVDYLTHGNYPSGATASRSQAALPDFLKGKAEQEKSKGDEKDGDSGKPWDKDGDEDDKGGQTEPKTSKPGVKPDPSSIHGTDPDADGDDDSDGKGDDDKDDDGKPAFLNRAESARAAQRAYTQPSPLFTAAAKVEQIAAAVLASNPGLGREQARLVAQETVARYPGMLPRMTGR